MNRCSVVSIFIAFLKFRPTTYRTHPTFPALVHLTYAFCYVHDSNSPPSPSFHFLLQGVLLVDYQIYHLQYIYQ